MASNNHERSSEDSPVDESRIEKGQSDQQDSLKPVGFFNPALNKVRNEVFVLWARTSKSSLIGPLDILVADKNVTALILSVFILTVLSLCKTGSLPRTICQI